MKLLLATFRHETNTFSPVISDRKRFFRNQPLAIRGEQALDLRRRTGTAMGGFIEVCETKGIDLSIPVVADARPSGLVLQDVFDYVCGLICEDLSRHRYDGVLLDLHGAMVTEDHEDAEGELLRRLRRVDAKIPIAATLDMHANLYPEFVDRVTIITGYHTYPHVDVAAAGRRAADLLIKTIRSEITPRMYWSNRPMMPHIMKQGTHELPNKGLQQVCMDLESSGRVLAASLFTGFPHADILNVGLSAVVCTDGEPEIARSECEALLDLAWDCRRDFVYSGRSLTESFAAARSAVHKPVVLLDHCDNAASGGTMDTTQVLRLAIEQQLENTVFFAIRDPEAVAQAEAAGVGGSAEFVLGGKADLVATNDVNAPIRVQASVATLHDGNIKLFGPMMAGLQIAMGRTAVLVHNGLTIVVISGYVEPSDRSCFASLGIDVPGFDYIILKSRVHWRAGLGDVAQTVIECDSIGVTTSSYAKLRFSKVRRPIFPLDDM